MTEVLKGKGVHLGPTVEQSANSPRFTAEQIANWVGGKVVASPFSQSLAEEGWRSIQVERLAPLAGSGARDLCFFFSRDFEEELLTARPRILVVAPPFVGPLSHSGLAVWKEALILSSDDPYLGLARTSRHFAEKISTVAYLPERETSKNSAVVHPTAQVHPSVKLSVGVSVGAFCVVERDAVLGEGAVLNPHCFVGPQVKIGAHSVLFPHVVVYEGTEIGKRVRIHANAVVGADGFGYAPVREAGLVVDHCKIYHLGKVIIEDDVEIGAGTTIDRGTLSDTRVGAKAKIDNLVHVGHNAQVGEGSVLCGCVGLSGNAKVGKFCIIGGQAGIANHVKIGDRASVGGFGAISKDIPPGGAATGHPQRDIKEFFKVNALLTRLLKEREARRSEKKSTDES